MIGTDVGECPIKRCDGRMVVEGYGATDDGRPIEWSICSACARTREHVGPLVPEDHPTLDLGGEA